MPTEAEEARQIIDERLHALQWMTWDELAEYEERTEEVVTPSGRRFEVTSVAFWDMDEWESQIDISVKVRPDRGWRRRWRYKGWAVRGDEHDDIPDPPPGYVPYKERKPGDPPPPLPNPVELLTRELAAHQKSRSPSIETDDQEARDAHADLVELDRQVARLLSHVVGGSDPPPGTTFDLDPALRERLTALTNAKDWRLAQEGESLLWSYDRLAQLARLAERAQEWRRGQPD